MQAGVLAGALHAAEPRPRLQKRNQLACACMMRHYLQKVVVASSRGGSYESGVSSAYIQSTLHLLYLQCVTTL